MRRVILTSSLVSACVSALVTIIALSVVAPAIAGAQASRVSGDEIVAVGPDGQPRVRLGLNPFGGGQAQILAVDGTVRVAMSTGSGTPRNPDEPNPANVGINIRNREGVTLARLGASVYDSGDVAQPHLRFRDSANNERLLVILDEDGSPSIQLLDAAGNVLWSAP